MHLTRFTDYALRILIYLGINNDRTCTILEIADRYKISKNHLVKIVHQLGKEGIITTTRGRDGGLKLANEPSDITIGEIVRNTEENFNLVECFDLSKNQCQLTSACVLSDVIHNALKAFLKVLDEITLADIIEPEKKELMNLLRIKVI